MNARPLSSTPSLKIHATGDSADAARLGSLPGRSQKRSRDYAQLDDDDAENIASKSRAVASQTRGRFGRDPIAFMSSGPSPSRSPRLESSSDCPFGSPLQPRCHRGDESIILVGFYGVGKRTLGLITSGALQREFVDYEEVFKAHTGQSSSEYLESHGFTAYRAVEDDLTVEVCQKKRLGCVLVGFFVMPSSRQRKLLASLAGSNPIIHIRRDIYRRSDRNQPDDGHLDQTYRVSEELHRKLASHEFFNITQSATDVKAVSPLKLKGTEREFIRFLHQILPQPGTSSDRTKLWSKPYTYALQVPSSWLDDPQADFTELDCGADAISLTVDHTSSVDRLNLYSQLSRHIALLRKHSHVPVIIDLEVSGTISPAEHGNLLELCLRQAPDFIVISLDIDNALSTKLELARGNTSIIGKCHRSLPVSDNWNSKEWHDIYEKAKALNCVAVRLTGEAHYSHDKLESIRVMLEARRLGAIPTICYDLGDYGRSSVCLNSILSPVVLPSKSADGVTLMEAQRALYSAFILPRKHFTVFGQTVSYSLSPALHNAGYAACGMPHTCDAVESDHVSKLHDLLQRESQGGVAVSLPFKTEIVPMMDEMSDDARIIGAVNTIVVDRISAPGKPPRIYLKGYNTDHIGFRSCIERNLSPANAIRSQSSALIIGAGGMARAAIYACVQAGVKNICIFNRTKANADRLSEYFSAACPGTFLHVLESLATPWPAHIAQPTIIVSCIPTHEFAGKDAPDILIPEDWLGSPTGGVFVEFAYKPLVTKLVEYMRQRSAHGWIVVDGLDVLVEEGIAQFEVLTQRPAPSHVIRKAVREQYGVIVDTSYRRDNLLA